MSTLRAATASLLALLLAGPGPAGAGVAVARVGRRLAVERLVVAELASDPAAVEARLAALRRSAAVEILLPLGGAP